jgi:gamma-glutamyl phosphate reductase
MTGRGARRGCLVLVLTTGLLTSACTSVSSSPGKAQGTDSKVRYLAAADKFDYRETRYIKGVVTAIPNDLYYTAELDINGKNYDLADVWTIFDTPCGNFSDSRQNKELLKIMRTMVPVGTHVVGVVADSSPSVFLHVAPPTGPTPQ